MGKYQIAGEWVPFIRDHLGGTAVIPAGGTVSLSLPTGTNCVYFKTENGAAYYAVNAVAAGTVTMGYIASGGSDMIFEVNNLGTVSVFAAAGVTVHTQYYG